jgi:hypothetical protein
LLRVKRHRVFVVGVQVAEEECFQPAKGKKAMGAATPTFTPTIPTSHRLEYSRADLPLAVKMAVALP